MSEVVFYCLDTGRAFNSGIPATRGDGTAGIRLRCEICGKIHEFNFSAASICRYPALCHERKDCQRCGSCVR
jgi:hypothetical protein